MPDYLEYRKSISNELISIKDRVRNFIDNNHWGEDGRYKEIILSDILKRHLPQNVSVATGFVMGDGNQISSQIDIIIYKNNYPVLFKIDDFVVVPKESVLGIIEVKTKLVRSNIKSAIEKSYGNGQLIGKQNIFNGIFGYETEFEFNVSRPLLGGIETTLRQNHGFLNNICFGKDHFMRYWNTGNPRDKDNIKCYSFYKIKDLSFGYFISNLIEDIYLQLDQEINDTFKSYLYPIEESKEAHRLVNFEIKL